MAAILSRILLGLLLFSSISQAAVLNVGPNRPYALPSEAALAARHGDVIEIDAGNYAGDAAVWRQNNLVIRGVGGMAHLMADGVAAEGKAIWVIKGDNTSVEFIEFSGAAVADGYGAGIRSEGAGLTLRHCYFHDNENGILGGAGDVLIEHTEFARNGSGDGLTHNIYISQRVKRFTLRFSYSHHARIGHNVKSRARENFILYNRIMDEVDGSSSYAIDLPDGGIGYVIGNLIQHGPLADNLTQLSYGAESLLHPVNELYVVNNTFVNDRDQGRFIRVAAGSERVQLINNLFIGNGSLPENGAQMKSNLTLKNAGLIDRTGFDYRLAARSPAINAGTDPGTVNGQSLVPVSQYLHPRRNESRPAIRTIDVGAYEFAGTETGWLP